MDYEQQGESKKMKEDKGKDIIDLEQDQNQEMSKVFIEEEQPATQIVVAKSKKKKIEEYVLKYRDYSYATAHEGKFKRKNEMLTSYVELRR